MYSLGILCIPRSIHANRYNTLINQRENNNSSFSHPKVRASHLNRWLTLPMQTTLTITPRCVPHILIGNVQSYTSMSQTKRNNADLWQLAKIHSHPTVNTCAIFHMTAKQITVVSTRMKPIDMSCSKNENSAKLMTDGIKIAQLRSHKSKFCPVRNRPKLWNFQNDNERATKTSKTSRNRIHSSLSLTTLCTAFCILHCNCRSSLPELSVTTQLASESKIYTQQSMLQAP